MIYTHRTAPTQFIEATGIRFAYRRFGKSGGVPLVFNQHFTGTMDHWDPAATDGLATVRISEVDTPAGARRERQGCDYLFGELVHPAAEHLQPLADPLPRLQPRLAISVPTAVRLSVSMFLDA
jgi:hypothetical protein